MLNYNEQYKLKHNRTYCANCGKYGHMYKTCNEPTISLGILSFKLVSAKTADDTISTRTIDTAEDTTSINTDDDATSTRTINTDDDTTSINTVNNYSTCNALKELFTSSNISTSCGINILKDNNINYNNIQHINKYKDRIKFLLIQRKNTLGYCEFVRGRYSVENINHLISLFQQMTHEEIEKIKTFTFHELWRDLWQSPGKNKIIHRCEYERSEQKFTNLKNSSNLVDLYFFTNNVHPEFKTPEWGFPKGRRNFHERNDMCAKREFREETGYQDADHVVLNKLLPLSETFNGTNNVPYKHIYYISMMESNREPSIDAENYHQIDEIGDIGWFTYSEVIKKLRYYHVERRKLLNEFYIFLANSIIELEKKRDTEYKPRAQSIAPLLS